MAKKLGLVSPTQLWGKPLKSAAPHTAPEEKVTGKMTYDEDVTEDEIDVDAELANADVEEDEELHAIEAETEAEVSDEIETGEPDEEEATEDDEPDYDAEEGDVSDEAEDAVEDDEEVVTAVVDDNEEGDDEIPTTTGKSSMSEKMSLSDHVRAEIARRQKAGESPIRGKDIVETLAKRKLKVSPAQVSQLLKKAGLGGQPRGKKATTAPAAASGSEKIRVAQKAAKKDVEPAKVAAKTRPAGNGFKVPMEQLKAAEAFVASCGGSFQSAERILTAAAQLSQTFGG